MTDLRPIPEPLYPCENCSEEFSWSAEDLAWYEGNNDYGPGWYCTNCSDVMEPAMQPVISLKQELKQRGFSR